MKVGIICDTHFGIRSDAHSFIEYQQKFFENIFFPTLKEQNISTVVHLGDLVDRRKYVNYLTYFKMKEMFLNQLGEYNCYFIAGNHDTYHKNTNALNCYQQLIEGKYPYKVYTEAEQVVLFDKYPILFVPWINSENYQRSFNLIENSSTDLLFGHLEISGFEMNRGVVCEHGVDGNIFGKYDFVFTGHFHQKSHKNNIFYLGAPYQMTWSDYNCPRGFHIFDLETRELTFIPNPYQMFHRLVYDDTGSYNIQQILEKEHSIADIKGSFCKVVIAEKNNPLLFDQFILEVEKRQPFDLKIVEQSQILVDDGHVDVKCEDTITIINKTIDGSEINCDKNKLKQLMAELYNQSQDFEV